MEVPRGKSEHWGKLAHSGDLERRGVDSMEVDWHCDLEMGDC